MSLAGGRVLGAAERALVAASGRALGGREGRTLAGRVLGAAGFALGRMLAGRVLGVGGFALGRTLAGRVLGAAGFALGRTLAGRVLGVRSDASTEDAFALSSMSSSQLISTSIVCRRGGGAPRPGTALAASGIGGSVRDAPGKRGGFFRAVVDGSSALAGTVSSHAIWTSIVCRRIGPPFGVGSAGGISGGGFDDRVGGREWATFERYMAPSA